MNMSMIICSTSLKSQTISESWKLWKSLRTFDEEEQVERKLMKFQPEKFGRMEKKNIEWKK